MKVLVTGGAGYIGSTIVSALEDAGITPIILDNLSSGRREFTQNKVFYQGDIADHELLKRIFAEHSDIEYTIHCAALIVVPDSVRRPYEYYHENVNKTLDLLKYLNELGCRKIIFSSSAAIYDDASDYVVDETSRLNPRSTYARTKYMMEMILKDFCLAYDMKAISFRYFNPIGADPKMRSGSYIDSPSHLLGKLISVFEGKENTFYITGTNWDTRDGTGIRDYIHVWDLAMAHVTAVEKFDEVFKSIEKECKVSDPYQVFNLGNGKGTTVREMAAAFMKVTGKELNIKETEAREGDVPGAYANAEKAKHYLGWQTSLTIEEGIRDSIQWSQIWKSRKED